MIPRRWAFTTLAVAMLMTAPLAAAHAASAADSTTTIFLVRHAEKDTVVVGADPPLSAKGILRAQELARVLGDVPLSAIYVTPYQRNRQTAQPLATHLGDTLTVITSIGPVTAPAGTVAFNLPSVMTSNTAFTPAKVTAVAPSKPLP